MKIRPANEPSRDFNPHQRLWDDAGRHSLSLGCPTCPDFQRCGGLHNEARIMDCTELCSCADKSKCDMVCRVRPTHYVQRVREVGGLELESAPRVPLLKPPMLPSFVPWLDHKYGREGTLNEAFVALSLYDVVNLATGKVHARSRLELAERFRIPPDGAVILTGVGHDPQIERWWELKDRAAVLSSLRELNIALVTAPNYSVLTNVPRPDNFYSMKRTLLTWTEIVSAGIPAALHINARTERDYENWTALIRERSEIEILAFEFATGCGYGDRINWHVAQLCRLAREVERPLTIVIRGGTQKLAALGASYSKVILIDTEPFARTIRRRQAHLTEGGRLRWSKIRTPKGAPIDGLLADNVAVTRTARLSSLS